MGVQGRKSPWAGLLVGGLLATFAGNAALPTAASAADPVGRYSITQQGAAGAPVTVMLDTLTGQSWVLVQTPGPPLHWAPIRFWTPGDPPTLVPLPPAPSTIGTSTTPLTPVPHR